MGKKEWSSWRELYHVITAFKMLSAGELQRIYIELNLKWNTDEWQQNIE